MAVIPFVWGQRQGVMASLGTRADAGTNTIAVDVSTPLSVSASATFDILIRRTGQTSYEAAKGLSPGVDGDGNPTAVVSYTLTDQDLSVPGVVWVTCRAHAGETAIDWVGLAWVAGSVYEQHSAGPSALWVEALLAFASELNGCSASVTLTDPAVAPSAVFGQGLAGWNLALSLPDVRSLGSAAGHKVFQDVSGTAGLLALSAGIGDAAILTDLSVYYCVGDGSQLSGWARLTDDPNANQGGTGGGETITTYVPPTVVPFTIQPGDWSGSSAQVTNAAVTAGGVGFVMLPAGASAAQYDLFAAARVRVSAQAAGSLTLSAGGTVPDAALVLELVLFG